MLVQSEAEHQHLLAMVEAAQRAGRTESEIVAIIDRYFGEATSRGLGFRRESSGERGRVGIRSGSRFRRS